VSPRRRTDKLGPALDVELLLADLLARAEAGNLPLASEDERWAWLKGWGAEHPGHYVPDARMGQRMTYGPEPDWEDMPVGVARRDAINFIEVILLMVPRAKRSTAENLARESWAREHPKPPADADSHGHLNADEWGWQREQAAYLAAHREAFDVIEEQAQAEAAEERAWLIRKFTLTDLVRGASRHSVPPPRAWTGEPVPGRPDDETPRVATEPGTAEETSP
jgi:hypothetical protein